jgi:two-component system, cell cycle sensor histidine kinase and response regulator CckA
VVPTRDSAVLTFVQSYVKPRKSTPRKPSNVLVVDDEEAVRLFVARVVQEAGYQTTTASDGPEAIEAASKLQSIDLLITDLMMPKMSGDELARRLRMNQPSLKVLHLTGFSDRLFKERTTLWQDEAFLEKPCSVKGLMEAIELLLFGRLQSTRKAK